MQATRRSDADLRDNEEKDSICSIVDRSVKGTMSAKGESRPRHSVQLLAGRLNEDVIQG